MPTPVKTRIVKDKSAAQRGPVLSGVKNFSRTKILPPLGSAWKHCSRSVKHCWSFQSCKIQPNEIISASLGNGPVNISPGTAWILSERPSLATLSVVNGHTGG